MLEGDLHAPPVTSRQRRELAAAEKALGAGTQVLAFAAGRANARWSLGAQIVVGAFVAASLIALLFFQMILFPGFLVIIFLFETVKPRRGLAVTGAGVVELRLGFMNGYPDAALMTADHNVLFTPTGGSGTTVRLGNDQVSLKSADLIRLQRAVPPAGSETSVDPSAIPLPPPPGPVTSSRPMATLPRWRRASILWILAHVLIGFALFIGVALLASDTITGWAGRDANRTSEDIFVYLWAVLAGTIGGWLLFVYVRSTFRTRVLLLFGGVGGALVLFTVVSIANSPPIAG